MHTLTKYPAASLREFAAISLPLMLASISGMLMIYLDRFILAHYSTTAMNASVAAGTTFAIFEFGALSIAGMTEVFVGYYHGAKHHHKVGIAVWQMIWFSLMTALFFWPIGYWGSDWFLTDIYKADGGNYFRWLSFFGPVFALNVALTGFFVSLGRVKLITVVMILGNLVNLVLDIAFVFGVDPILPSMGTKGAAIASGLGQLFIFVVLATLFGSRNNHHRFATLAPSWHPKIFWGCIRLGLPNGIGHMFAIGAWSYLAYLLSTTSTVHMTVFATWQSVWILLAFGADGLNKAATAITANYLGANQLQELAPKIISSAVLLVGIVSLFTTLPYLVFPGWLVTQFLDELPNSIDYQVVYASAVKGFYWSWPGSIFDYILWTLAGFLTAVGDTRFIMFALPICIWTFAIVTSYALLQYNSHADPVYISVILSFSLLATAFVFFLRYKKGYWKNQDPTDKSIGIERFIQ